MKKVNVLGSDYKVTKAFIREILKLDRSVSYYSRYNENDLAHAIANTWFLFCECSDSITAKVERLFDCIEGVVYEYEKEYAIKHAKPIAFV